MITDMATETLTLPTQEYLLENFNYDPITGILSRRGGKKHHRFPEGSQCGSLNSRGHIQVRAPLKLYQAHRLIWMMVTGEDPGELQVEHKDTIKTNNAWCNLRLSTQNENMYNVNKLSNNTSGCKNIHQRKDTGMYSMSIRANKKVIYLGQTPCLETAKNIVADARIKYHGQFTNHGN